MIAVNHLSKGGGWQMNKNRQIRLGGGKMRAKSRLTPVYPRWIDPVSREKPTKKN
jgi:hypothetical protein